MKPSKLLWENKRGVFDVPIQESPDDLRKILESFSSHDPEKDIFQMHIYIESDEVK